MNLFKNSVLIYLPSYLRIRLKISRNQKAGWRLGSTVAQGAKSMHILKVEAQPQPLRRLEPEIWHPSSVRLRYGILEPNCEQIRFMALEQGEVK